MEAYVWVCSLDALTHLPQFKEEHTAVYSQFRQKFLGEDGRKATIPDGCLVFPAKCADKSSNQLRALVIELKYGSTGDSAQQGMDQIADCQYVTRARLYVQERMGVLLEQSAISTVSYKLNNDMSVTMALPPAIANSK